MNNIEVFIVLVFAIIAALFFVSVFIATKIMHKNAEQKRAEHIAINNTIVDLHEAGYIVATGEKGNRGVAKTEGKAPLATFQKKVLDIGFPGDAKLLSTEEFHTNIYKAREELVAALAENPDVDRDTKPSNRIYSSTSDDGGAVVLPLLFLGTAEGSHFSYNPAYQDSPGYAGSSEIGGSSGDSGGGDGGGGGGGE